MLGTFDDRRSPAAWILSFFFTFFAATSASAATAEFDSSAAPVCPTGWRASGLNCCRVVSGATECRRQPRVERDERLSRELESLMSYDDKTEPGSIDDRDLTGAGSVYRSLDEFSRVITGRVTDTCDTVACTFDHVRSVARNSGPRMCLANLNRHFCQHSMWRDLSIEQRFRRILEAGQPFARLHGIDVRALPCIAARETVILEPLSVSHFNCQRYASDQGLGQIIWPTFQGYFRRLGFRTRLAPEDPPPGAAVDDAQLRRIFSNLGQSAAKQVELMSYTLADKKRGRDYVTAFTNYNGSAKKHAYARMVNACYTCMVNRVNAATLEVRGDPMQCLSAALGSGRDIRKDFDRFKDACK